MHEIIFYHDKNGYEPVNAYIDELSTKKDKDSRIKYNKILEYIHILREKGITAGEPYMKHLDAIFGSYGLYATEFFSQHGLITLSYCYTTS